MVRFSHTAHREVDMAKAKEYPAPLVPRTPRQEALAARVRAASEAAIAALHDAREDRRFIHDLEWGQAEHDTLADIDEAADALQGIAARILSDAPHTDFK